MNARVERFVGKGNISLAEGHRRGWQIVCSGCGEKRIVTLPSGGEWLPPEVIIKKLGQAGWLVGKRPADDLCQVCRKKPATAKAAVQPKPTQTNGHGGKFESMVARAQWMNLNFPTLLEHVSKLNPDRAQQVIKAAQKAIPKPKVKRRKESPVLGDDEYQNWLREQQAQFGGR